MRTGLHSLEMIESATGAVFGLANLVNRLPAGQARDYAAGSADTLGKNLFALENSAQQHLASLTRSPVVAPNPARVGAWVDEVRRQPGMQNRLEQVQAPPFIDAASAKIQQDAMAVAQWLAGGNQPARPASAPMGSATGVAAAAVIVNPAAAARTLGGILQLVGMGATGLMAWLAHRDEKKRKGAGIGLDEDDDPFIIRQNAAKALEDELPGVQVSLVNTPDGAWVSSVKRGREVISRVTDSKPQRAAGEAVKRALEYQDAKTIDVNAEVVSRSEA
jgi:hypothetical protein